MARLTLTQGGQLYYHLISGEADKPCLVFLHEGLGSTAMWKAFPVIREIEVIIIGKS